MKKLTALLTAILLTLSLIGCQEVQKTDTLSIAVTPSPTAKPTPTPTEKPTPEPTAQPTTKPTEKPIIKSEAPQKIERTVYITRTGEKYHRGGCQYLRQSKIAISLDKAQAQGYDPCSKCNP